MIRDGLHPERAEIDSGARYRYHVGTGDGGYLEPSTWLLGQRIQILRRIVL